MVWRLLYDVISGIRRYTPFVFFTRRQCRYSSQTRLQAAKLAAVYFCSSTNEIFLRQKSLCVNFSNWKSPFNEYYLSHIYSAIRLEAKLQATLSWVLCVFPQGLARLQTLQRRLSRKETEIKTLMCSTWLFLLLLISERVGFRKCQQELTFCITVPCLAGVYSFYPICNWVVNPANEVFKVADRRI